MIIVHIPGHKAIFVSCDAEIHKATTEEQIEDNLLPDRQYTSEKISAEGEMGSWQVYSFPKAALPKIRQIGGSSVPLPIYPLQAALRVGVGIGEPYLYVYADNEVLGMTTIVGQEVSSFSIIPPEHLLQSVTSAVADFKALYHLSVLRVLTNDEVTVRSLQSLKAEVLRPSISTNSIPIFVFPEQVFLARAEKSRRELFATSGIIGLLALGVWGFYFSSIPNIRTLEVQKSALAVEVKAAEDNLATAKGTDLSTLFPEAEKQGILVFLARCNRLPPGFELGIVKIERKEGLITAEATIKASLLGLPAEPLTKLFPNSKITPQFQKDGQGYLISSTLGG